jgi:hypothetical protein
MVKHNKWTGGVPEFCLGNRSPSHIGRVGCSLQRAIFDPNVGTEVFALFSEDPAYVSRYEQHQKTPLTLIPHKGLVRTPNGVIAFIVWQIAAGLPHETFVDHYINPTETAAWCLLGDAGSQSHFKLLIVNSQSFETAALIDFENTFEFSDFAKTIRQIERRDNYNFKAACSYVMANMSVQDLMAAPLAETASTQR